MNSTVFFKNKPSIIATATIAGPKEGEGELGKYIEKIVKDDMFGEKTFEKAERKMLTSVIKQALKNAKLTENVVGALIMGDLLNQIISASFTARRFDIPYLGVYNACSTMTESLAIAAALVDGGYLPNAIAATGSHFSTAERQYRYPLELGSVRPPQSQWTVTGAGSCVLSLSGSGPSITCATVGKIVDYGVTDANNMGAAMAPCAAETLITFFNDTKTNPDDYDLIVSGDLGTFGSRLLKDLVWEKGFDIEKQHVDCGELIYNISENEYQGGSGAGCSALVFCSYLYNLIKAKKYKKILLAATGALLSSLTTQQGESIPSISHAVEIGV